MTVRTERKGTNRPVSSRSGGYEKVRESCKDSPFRTGPRSQIAKGEIGAMRTLFGPSVAGDVL